MTLRIWLATATFASALALVGCEDADILENRDPAADRAGERAEHLAEE